MKFAKPCCLDVHAYFSSRSSDSVAKFARGGEVPYSGGPSQSVPLAVHLHVHGGKEERFLVCRPKLSALLDVPKSLRACVPAWTHWQAPAERLFGTLSRSVLFRRSQMAGLTTPASTKSSADLFKSFADTRAADGWKAAPGNPARRQSDYPAGKICVFEEPKMDLLPPRRATDARIGHKLACLMDVLLVEGVSRVPAIILAKKNFSLRLANSQLA